VRTLDADVVILGRRADTDVALWAAPGNVAYTAASRSLAPCLVVAKPLTLPVRKTIVGIDWTETARGALLVALSWVSAVRPRNGSADDATLTALHVHPGGDATSGVAPVDGRTIEHELSVLRRNAGTWGGVTVESETLEGEAPADIIANYAVQHGAELLVLGTRGFMEPEDRLGSVSTSVTARVSIPVLLVPPAVWRDYTREIDYF
jgi:nucleotide-binding universal stress UspA family protein